MIYLGIDPGSHGIIARFPVERGGWEFYIATPESLRSFPRTENQLAVLEKLHAFPVGGKVANFELGKYYGEMGGALEALFIPYIEVSPVEWKKVVLKDMDWKKNKMASVEYVQKRFPHIDLLPTPRCTKPDHNKADAICLALYGMEKQK
ncbi:MAG: hypothetical protein WC356_06750 [Candidatus Micrarchaeia archaeon]|jgi:hypothetical protein